MLSNMSDLSSRFTSSFVYKTAMEAKAKLVRLEKMSWSSEKIKPQNIKLISKSDQASDNPSP